MLLPRLAPHSTLEATAFEATHRSQFWQDILTDDEIISDSYDLKEIDGVAYEADCKKISVGGETFGAHSSPALDCICDHVGLTSP